MARRRSGRPDENRGKAREISDAQLARMAKGAGVRQGGDSWKTPVDLADDPRLVDQMRSDLSETAGRILEQNPRQIRGFSRMAPAVLELVTDAVPSWGRPGVLRLPKGPVSSERSRVATQLALAKADADVRFDSRIYDASDLTLSAVREAFYRSGFRDVYGNNAGIIDSLNRNFLQTGEVDDEVATSETGVLDPAVFKKASAALLEARIGDKTRDVRERLTTVHGRVLDIFVSPTGEWTAENLRMSLPEDDFRQGVEKIDWQVLYDEERRRGSLPDGAIGIITGTISATCEEVGIDYVAWNSIPTRRDELLMPVQPKPAYSQRWDSYAW